MESNLRPLTLGEILDRTAQLYRTNFLLFAGIASVYAGVVLVLGLLQIGAEELLRALHMSQYSTLEAGCWVLLTIPLMVIFAGAAVAANNRAVSWVNVGRPATIRGAYSTILPRLGRYLWLMTIVTFVVWTPFALILGSYLGGIFFLRPMSAKGTPPNPQVGMTILLISAVFVLLAIAWMVYAILMSLRYSLAIPACVVEDLKARKAIQRSIDLSKGSRGRIFLLGLLIVVIQTGLVLIAQLVFVVAAVKSHGLLPLWVRVLQQLVAFVTNSFIGPMYATGLTLFYYDQRIRKEGFDIEWMMQAAGMTAAGPVVAQPSFAEPVAAEPDSTAAEAWPALEPHRETPFAAEAEAASEQPPAAADPVPPLDGPPPDSGVAHE
jgi:hypothetical protein